MNTVKTMVRDLSGHDRVLRWAGKGGVWMGANSIVILDTAYPAACKSTQAVRTMEAEVNGKSIEVTIVTNFPILNEARAAEALVAPAAKQEEILATAQQEAPKQPEIKKEVKSPLEDAEKADLVRRIREAAARMKAEDVIPDRKLRPMSEIPAKIPETPDKDQNTPISEGHIEDLKPEAVSLFGESAPSIAEERKDSEIVSLEDIFSKPKASKSSGTLQAPEAESKGANLNVTPNATTLTERKNVPKRAYRKSKKKV